MKYLSVFILFLIFSINGVQGQGNRPTPSKLQMQWQKMEQIAFIHFSINTFTDMEWGYGNESPSLFNPTALDCRQWVKICRDAGLKGVILTAKHHDGFCLWPSKYTEHSVKNSLWKNGNGDVVREFSEACKEYGLKMGLYLSPWDCNHPDYGKPGYNQYFKNQLTELLTNYGELFEIWFDGANGGRGYYGTDSLHNRSIPADYYDWKGFVDIVRRLQPNCIIHGGGLPDIRWVGNEEGFAGETHWSTLRDFDKFEKEVAHTRQLNTGHEDGTNWLPSETDVSLRPGWYYHAFEDHKVKTLPKLMDIYYESVGRNSLLLLNLSPNKQGLIHPADSARLMEWKKQLSLDFEKNLVNKKCRFSAGKTKKVKRAFDSDSSTFWKATGNSGFLEIDFGKETTFNRLLLQEYIPDGQNVKSFTVSIWGNGNWSVLKKGTTIGYKRILRFLPVKSQKIKISIDESLAPPEISTIEVYNAPVLPSQPEIRRNQAGFVTIISPDKNGVVYYTTDGSQPTVNSARYSQPFQLDGTALIKAIIFNGTDVWGETTVQKFNGSKAAWKVVGETKENPLLFDGNPGTTWTSKGGIKKLEIDLGKPTVFQGITYLPDQSRGNYGIALDYLVSVSEDGSKWEPAAKGEFSNIRNNPILQTIRFTNPRKARFLKLETTSVSDGHPSLGIAELDIITE